ncbi:MAG TPA: hypothetical protein VJ350_05195 [Methanoregula sp.]|nr:hypothetical protein [Methanoregula sp.]
MNVSVIIAHPHPGSFNHAIAETVIRALEENCAYRLLPRPVSGALRSSIAL